MFERFTKLFAKNREGHVQEDQVQIGNPSDLRQGDSNSTTPHNALPKFEPEGLISLEAAQAKLSREDQTRNLAPWQRPAVVKTPDVNFDFSGPVSHQDAKAEFATVGEAQAILKDNAQPTVSKSVADNPANDVQQSGVGAAKPSSQWVSAKPNLRSGANEILEQNRSESTPRLNAKPDHEMARTFSPKKL